MRTIYAIQLQVAPNDLVSPADLFQQLTLRVKSWVEEKYSRAWKTTLAIPQNGIAQIQIRGHSVIATSGSAEDASLFSLEWTHPDDDDASTSWVTSCVVARSGNSVQISLIVRISTTKIVLRPVRFDLGRPRLVTDVLKHYSVSIEDWNVPTDILRISSPQVQPFVERVLLNPARTLPVILISPDAWNGRQVVDPSALFLRVMGFAHVVTLADKWSSFKLTDELGKQLSCFDGAVRIYWPGLRLDDSPFQHRLFLPHSILFHEQNGLPLAEHLFRTLAAVASFRYTEGHALRNARRAIADLDRKGVDELREQVKSGSIEKEILETQLLEALMRIDKISDERDQMKSDLAAQQAAWAEVQQAIAATDTPPSEIEDKVRFGSVLEAIEAAKKNFSGPLVFLDSSLESARNSPYKDPERVYELFEALALVANDWKDKKGTLGRTWNHAVTELGFDLRDQISMTSKGKHSDEYKFLYKGQRRMCEKHITVGAKQADKCLSVHWYRDDDDLVLAIAHCGRHLSNTSS